MMTTLQQLIDARIKELLALRDASIYRLVDYRISKGEWKPEDRQLHFDELLAIIERTEQKVLGPEVLH
jgi:hypothetical protein